MNESLLNVMTGAVVISALALILNACFMGVMAMSARAIKARLDEFTPKAESLIASAEKTLAESKKQIDEVTSKASDVLDTTKKQVDRTDEFLTDATNRARVQLDRVELVLDDTIGRVHETVVILNKGILKPLRELNGISTGIRTALHYLLRGGRPSVDQATTDEEMFI